MLLKPLQILLWIFQVLTFIKPSGCANAFEEIIPVMAANSISSWTYSLNYGSGLTSYVITGWFKTTGWAASTTSCYHLLDFTSNVLTAGSFHHRICISYQNSAPYFIAWQPNTMHTTIISVNSAGGGTTVPTSVLTANIWNYFYFGFSNPSTTIVSGLGKGGIPSPTLNINYFVDSVSSATPVTSFGTTLQFIFGKGKMAYSNFAFTGLALNIQNVRFYPNMVPSTAQFTTFMQNPVTSWYRYTYQKVTPTSISVAGVWPSEPAFNTLPLPTTTVVPQPWNILYIPSGVEYLVDVNTHADFLLRSATVGFWIKIITDPSVIMVYYDGSNYFNFYCSSNFYFQGGSTATPYVPCSAYVGAWVYMSMYFAASERYTAGNAIIKVTFYDSAMALIGTTTLATGSIPSMRQLYFGQFWDSYYGVFTSTYAAALYLKELTFFNGEMSYVSGSCLKSFYFQDSNFNDGTHCELCTSGNLQLGLLCVPPPCSFSDPYISTCDQCQLPSHSLSNTTFSCSVCGNGVHELGETCDDGNNIDFDGCSKDCVLEPLSLCKPGVPENCTCEPVPIYSETDHEWTYIKLMFKSTVQMATTTCSNLFINSNIFGVGANCSFNITNLTIQLGANPTVAPGSPLMLNKLYMTYAGTCNLATYKYNFFSFTGDMTLTPTVKISGPTYSEICQNFTLSIATTGAGNRPFEVGWVVSAAPDIDPVEIKGIVDFLQAQSPPDYVVMAGLLQINHTYTFKITVRNFLGNMNNDLIIVSTYMIPKLSFNNAIFYRWNTISLTPAINPYYCDALYDVSAIRLIWQLTSPNISGLVNPYVSPSTLYLIFPPDFLTVKTLYNFTVKSYLVDIIGGVEVMVPYSMSNYYFNFYIRESNLIATITGGDRQASFDTPLVIDASGSYDPDNKTNKNFIFTWSCQYPDKRTCTDQYANVLSFNNTPTLTFPAKTLLIGTTYVFNLMITKGTKSSTTRAKIKILMNNIPSAELRIPKSAIGKKYPVHSDLTINSVIYSKTPKTLTYTWTISCDSSGTMLPVTLPSSNLFGARTNSIKILQGTLIQGANYLFTLTINDQYGSSSTSALITINVDPQGGTINVFPLQGQSFNTNFVFETTFWTDVDLPLQYKYSYWNQFSEIGNMSSLRDITYWSYQSTITTYITNTDSLDFYIYVYSLCKDNYDAIGISLTYEKVFVEPKDYTDIVQVNNLYNTVFKDAYIASTSAILNSASLVARAMKSYDNHVRLRNLQVDHTVLKIQTDITSDVVSKITDTNILSQEAFEKSASIMAQFASKPDRVSSGTSSTMLNFINAQFDQNLQTEVGISTTGSSSVADLLNSIIESQIVNTPTGRRFLATGASATGLNQAVNSLFNSIALNQVQGENSVLMKDNFNLMSKRVSQYQVNTTGINDGNSTGPKFTLPTLSNFITLYKALDFDNVLKADESVGVNVVNWKTNIYNSSDPLTLNTNIVGLKLKKSSSNEEIPVSNLTTPIRVEIPCDKDQVKGSTSSFACIFFNEATQKWDNEGCVLSGFTTKLDGSKIAVCLCTHLTDFSVSNAFLNAFGNSGFQYITNVAAAFANGDLSSLKVLYVLICLIAFMMFFMVYGNYKDNQSKILNRTLVNRKEVMKIGLKNPPRRDSDSDNELEFQIKPKGTRNIKQGKDGKLRKNQILRGKSDFERGSLQFLSGYTHALKKSHNLLSIFQKYNPDFKRANRFWIYFVRFFGMLAVNSLFYTQTKVNRVSIVPLLIIMTFSFFFTSVILLILKKLLTSKVKHKRLSFDEEAESKQSIRKRRLGYFVSMIYVAVAIFFTLLVGLSVHSDMADAILNTFLIQLAYDIFISQPVKVFIQYLFLIFLARKYCNSCRKVMLMVLDANIKTSFI